MERKLKIVLCIAIIILIMLVAFVGVYTKDGVVFKNNLPNYSLSSDFKAKRIATFKLSDKTEEIIYDSEGKEVKSIPDGANEADYTKESKKVNLEESLKTENYKLVKEIFDGRLEELKVEDYKVRIDENTGKVTVEIEENYQTDKILQNLLYNGDFSITDSESGAVLLDKSDIKDVDVLYSRESASGITVYLDIKFNKEGSKKLAEVSKEYIKIEEDTESSDENTDSEDKKQKTVTLTIEGNDMLTTYFGEELTNGELTISLGSGTDTEKLQGYVEQAETYAMLINNPEMPLTYELETSNSAKGNLQGAETVIIGIIIAIYAIVAIYMIYKYKIDGLFGSMAIITAISILLIIVRYTNIQISLNALVAIVITMCLNAYLICKMLKNNSSYENVAKSTIRVYLENVEVILVTIIIAVVFTFMSKVAIYSFGMTLFYGIISVAVTNLILLRTMLLAKYSNK